MQQRIEGTYVTLREVQNSLKPDGKALPADAWTWALHSADLEAVRGKVRLAEFSSAVNGPVLLGSSDSPAAEPVPGSPLTVTQLCRLAGYPKAAAPLMAAGADAATVQEMLLSDRAAEFMGAIENGTADASYVLQVAAIESSPVVLIAKRMAAEAKQREAAK